MLWECLKCYASYIFDQVELVNPNVRYLWNALMCNFYGLEQHEDE